MRVLIIGYGSIGARHARVLTELGAEVAVVTRNSDCLFPIHRSIEAALQDWSPDRIMVCNATAMHRDAADVLLAANYRGLVLVEKPLFAIDADLDRFDKLDICVAYNLRFHALFRRLREEVSGRPLLTANFHAGQYLPDWRPSTDYRTGYSARRSEGGGVLKDLSHELDLAGWFCGSWTRVSAVGGQVSALEIDSDDVYAMLLVHEQCPVVTISLNYLNFAARRNIAINAAGLTGILDLIAGKLTVNGKESESSVPRDATYIAQARAMLDNDRSILCSFKEGRQTDRLIAAAEQASVSGRWVSANASCPEPENHRPER